MAAVVANLSLVVGYGVFVVWSRIFARPEPAWA